MPTYEYQCQACGRRFDLFQPITAAPIRRCPACGRNKARRLIGAGAGVLFKGSGFYQTDYRSDAYRKAAEKDSPAAASSTSSSQGGASDGAGSSTGKDGAASSIKGKGGGKSREKE